MLVIDLEYHSREWQQLHLLRLFVPSSVTPPKSILTISVTSKQKQLVDDIIKNYPLLWTWRREFWAFECGNYLKKQIESFKAL
jgi:hypothetical protein